VQDGGGGGGGGGGFASFSYFPPAAFFLAFVHGSPPFSFHLVAVARPRVCACAYAHRVELSRDNLRGMMPRVRVQSTEDLLEISADDSCLDAFLRGAQTLLSMTRPVTPMTHLLILARCTEAEKAKN